MRLLEAIDAFVKVLPGFQVAFVGHFNETILTRLKEKVATQHGEVKAFIYDEIPHEIEGVQFTKIDSYSKNFRTIARDYELLILNELLFTAIDREKIVKNCFKALENSGDILVIELEKEGIKESLEAYGFVAVNEIETDASQIYLISAKKMHGWGHGL